MRIIFYEDQAQLEKLLSHTKICDYVKVLYSGKKIIRLTAVKNNSESRCGIFQLISISIKSNVLTCEYSNGIPRFWATLFQMRLQSQLFGVLDYFDFDFDRTYKTKSIRKLMNRLYADEYLIYGSHNPTRDLADEIRNRYKAKVVLKERLDIEKANQKASCQIPWSIYIGQPWLEVGNVNNDNIQKCIYEEIKSHLASVYYCKHPRQIWCQVQPENLINGWLGLKEFIRRNGPPQLAISLNSSLIFELKEMGINAVSIADRINGQTVFLSSNDAIKRVRDEISSIC